MTYMHNYGTFYVITISIFFYNYVDECHGFTSFRLREFYHHQLIAWAVSLLKGREKLPMQHTWHAIQNTRVITIVLLCIREPRRLVTYLLPTTLAVNVRIVLFSCSYPSGHYIFVQSGDTSPQNVSGDLANERSRLRNWERSVAGGEGQLANHVSPEIAC